MLSIQVKGHLLYKLSGHTDTQTYLTDCLTWTTVVVGDKF